MERVRRIWRRQMGVWRRRSGGLVAAMAIAMLLAGCSGADDPEGDGVADDLDAVGEGGANGDTDPGEVVQVLMRELAFEPPEVEVPAGGAVTWTAVDVMEHTATSGERDDPDGQFDEYFESRGAAATITFDTPGSYPFFCRFHPEMTGVITVTG